MTLKAIDLQLAVHRNGDAGIIQNQHLQKPVHDQAMLAGHGVRTAEAERQKSTKTEESARAGIKDARQQDGKPAKSRPAAKKAGKMTESQIRELEHPYKGHHIDLTY